MATVKELSKAVDFPDLERRIMKSWKNNKTYEKVKALRKESPEYLFIDGPPYTTGDIHVGTGWNKVLKDFLLRYKRMRGYNVRDTPGYDMHGLPIEVRVEREMKITNKKQIEEIGIDKFVSSCREFALSFLDTMTDEFKRLGIWMNWKKPYMTLKNDYIEGVWWTIKRAYENGYLYKGLRPLNCCPRCETAVAKHEYEYQSVEDYSIFVKFAVEGKSNEYVVIWTTTPWTLPANLSVMVNPFFDYVKAEVGDEIWIMAKGMTTSFIQGLLEKDFKILEEFIGEKLSGVKYVHPLREEVPTQDELEERHEHVHRIILTDEFVTLEQGTGCVHSAPGHGPEDFAVGQKYGLPAFCPVDESGHMTEEAGKYAGMTLEKTSEAVIEDLKRKGLLINMGRVEHDYAHCWRCKTPLIYRATEQWFLKMSTLRDKMKNENNGVYWMPQWAGNPWFNNWIENIQDWCISRQRYWGTPLPIWMCDKCGDIEVIGSAKELRVKSKMEPEDLHRPWIDEVTWKCSCGGTRKRVEDVLDVWVDSGSCVWSSIPAMLGKKEFENWKQASLIMEGKDQIRGWFNTLMSLGVVTSGKRPYNAVYMHGMTNDEYGKPMSKSLGNFISPEEVTGKFGSETFRFYSIGTANPGEDMKFSWKAIKDTHRVLNILWNAYVFATTFMKSADFDPKKNPLEESDLKPEDEWILSRVNTLVGQVTDRFEMLDLQTVPRLLHDFIVLDLSRWYIKLIRERTWVTARGPEKIAGLATLYYTLHRLLQLLVPLTPVLAENFYQHLVRPVDPNAPESVHMTDWPETENNLINSELEDQMNLVQDIVEASLATRQEEGIKRRWPCQNLFVRLKGDVKLSQGELEIVGKMTNVHNVQVVGEVEPSESLKERELAQCWIYLDTRVTEKLKAERFVRELIRNVQFTRKKNAYHVGEEIELVILLEDKKLQEYAKRFEKPIKNKVTAKTLSILSQPPQESGKYAKGQMKYEDKDIVIYFKRTS
ncbi:MAG: isoleucine--tRNA ligase [Promethearchaeota archaeon]